SSTGAARLAVQRARELDGGLTGRGNDVARQQCNRFLVRDMLRLEERAGLLTFGVIDGRQTELVLGLQVSTVGDEQLHRFVPAVLRGGVQRRQALQVGLVDL